MTRDEGLRPFATDRQWAQIEAYWEHGSYTAAAEATGDDASNIRRAVRVVKAKAARRGHAIETHTDLIPEGYKLRGVSALKRVNPDGTRTPILEWHKTNEDRDRWLQLLETIGASIDEGIKRLEPLSGPEASPPDTMLACYPVGDHHNGMYAWAAEAGGDYDLDISKRLLTRAMQDLSARTPPTEQALVAFLGDFQHYDSPKPVTPASQHQLDSDGRFGKVVDVSFTLICGTIDLALRKHARVHVIIAPGNHDPYTMAIFARCVAALYADDPRVTVDTSPGCFHYFEWGQNLIMVHHGDKVKLENLPLVMAHDKPEAWGRCRYRTVWTGHYHHDRVKDVGGVRCETMKVLPPGDNFAHTSGYRSQRGMSSIVLSRDGGERERHTVDPEQLGT